MRLQSDTMSGRLQLLSLIRASFGICLELGAFLRSAVRPRSSLLAENLFLRKQLAFYQEHQIRPRRLTDAARLSLVFWSKLCNWKSALVIVKPETLIGWHRRAFKLFWKLKSHPGRPKLPKNIRQLIARMVEENPTWGQGRVTDELALKLGILVSPRTVGAYWPNEPDSRGPSSQRWNTFVGNHARSMLACDFLVVVTAGFRQLYFFVLMEVGTRRILHCNVTAHPTAAWTLQQFRESLPSDHGHKFLIHDHDSIFSQELVRMLRELARSYLTIVQDQIRVMSRLKALYRSWGIGCAGRDVYYIRHRAQWLAKLREEGVRRRAQRLYEQLDEMQRLRRLARHDLLVESRKHSISSKLRQIPHVGPIRAALLIALLQTTALFALLVRRPEKSRKLYAFGPVEQPD